MLLRCLLPLIMIVVICAGNTSCTKPTPAEPPLVDTTSGPPTNTSRVVVYVGGDTLANGYDGAAAYWKDGVITKLSLGVLSTVNSMYVDHDDVYTAVSGSTNASAITYWKNNNSITLPDPLAGSHASYGITLSDGNIYVTGTSHEFPAYNYGALYWKNNSPAVHLVPLEVTEHNSAGNDIAASNGDVYVAGYLDYKAAYWKNNTLISLPIDTTFAYDRSTANSIVINQGNVYVAGTINLDFQFFPVSHSIATYWKNNVPVRLTNGSVANEITISGNDIYVAGGIYGADGLTRAAYWKNGVPVMLSNNYSVARAIAVDGTDVYVAGNIGEYQTTFWKNGVPVDLGRGHANAIFLVPR